MNKGWRWEFGSGLVKNWYLCPGVTDVKTAEVGVQKFDSEESVRKVLKTNNLIREELRDLVPILGASGRNISRMDSQKSVDLDQWNLAANRF